MMQCSVNEEIQNTAFLCFNLENNSLKLPTPNQGIMPV